MAKNKTLLIGLLWLFSFIPVHNLVANDGYCVKLTAYEYIGVREKGGNNRGFNDADLQKILAKAGWIPGYAWCSFFVKAILDGCNIPNTITGWAPSAYNRNDVIYTNGKFYKSYDYNDVLVMTLSYNDGRGRYKNIGHTGIVELIGQYSVRTIEGNTNVKGQRDSRSGDGVYQKIRPLTKNLHITRWAERQN
jgi:hypothetical protein